MELYECHGHLLMDGRDLFAARERNREGVDEESLRSALEALREAGVRYFRDGGDACGVSAAGKDIAGEYGIEVITPVFAIHRRGRYGSIVGRGYGDVGSFRSLISELRGAGGDFVKLMLSGIMTFRSPSELSCDGLDAAEIAELINISHAEGFSVKPHMTKSHVLPTAIK